MVQPFRDINVLFCSFSAESNSTASDRRSKKSARLNHNTTERAAAEGNMLLSDDRVINPSVFNVRSFRDMCADTLRKQGKKYRYLNERCM